MIPMIDVMLVLLIVFIVAAPLLNHAVKIDLPQATSHPNDLKPEHIELAVTTVGTLYWNGKQVTEAELETRMTEAAQRAPQPELHIQSDARTPYEILARVMSSAARVNLGRIGFVSEPGGDR
jgi:biopolymer transport protein ExbD